jgi:hypothetical protein
VEPEAKKVLKPSQGMMHLRLAGQPKAGTYGVPSTVQIVQAAFSSNG